MNNLEIYRPLKTDILIQRFGENRACIKVDANNLIILPGRIIAKFPGQSCPIGYKELYPLLKMKGHNGYDNVCYHREPIYHSGTFDGWLKYDDDINGGIGIDVVSNEPFFEYNGQKHYVKLRYWHLKSRVGDEKKQVKTGDLIAYGDNTGLSSGNHLHWALKICDRYGNNTILRDNGYFGAIDHTPYYINNFVLTMLNVQEQAINAIQLANLVILLVKQYLQKMAKTIGGILKGRDNYNTMSQAKSLFSSKTFWVAVLQAIAGVLIVVSTELNGVGWALTGKSVVDVILRLLTNKPAKILG